MGKTWAEFFPSLPWRFDNYVRMAAKLVVQSALAQIQVLWPATQLRGLSKRTLMKLTIRSWAELKLD
jgi:hypothetical protein